MDRDLLADKIGFLRKWSCYPDPEIMLETDERRYENE